MYAPLFIFLFVSSRFPQSSRTRLHNPPLTLLCHTVLYSHFLSSPAEFIYYCFGVLSGSSLYMTSVPYSPMLMLSCATTFSSSYCSPFCLFFVPHLDFSILSIFTSQSQPFSLSLWNHAPLIHLLDQTNVIDERKKGENPFI